MRCAIELYIPISCLTSEKDMAIKITLYSFGVDRKLEELKSEVSYFHPLAMSLGK